jgi:hypothetical protein
LSGIRVVDLTRILVGSRAVWPACGLRYYMQAVKSGIVSVLSIV